MDEEGCLYTILLRALENVGIYAPCMEVSSIQVLQQPQSKCHISFRKGAVLGKE